MFAATLVFPTPPLPLVTAMTFTGFLINARSTDACWESSRMGGAHVRIVLSHGSLVYPRLGALQALHGLVDEPQPLLVRGVQVVRDTLAVRQPGGGEVVPDERADDATELRGLVDLGDDRSG